jgi:hypothetical protein
MTLFHFKKNNHFTNSCFGFTIDILLYIYPIIYNKQIDADSQNTVLGPEMKLL